MSTDLRTIEDAYGQIGAQYRARVDEIEQDAMARAEAIAKRREETAEKLEELKAEAQKKAKEQAKAAESGKDEDEDDKPKRRVDPWEQTRSAPVVTAPSSSSAYFARDDDEDEQVDEDHVAQASRPAVEEADEVPERQVKDPWAQALPSSQEQRTSAYYADDDDDDAPPPLTNEW